MANLMIDDDTVTVSLSTAEKVEAIHGDVTLPRSAITQVREVPDGMEEVHGLRGQAPACRGSSWSELSVSPVGPRSLSATGADLRSSSTSPVSSSTVSVVTVDNPEAAISILT